MKLIIDIPEEDYISVRCERLYYTGHDELAKIITKAFQNAKPYEERPQGEWVTTSHKTDLGTFEVNNKICSQCKHSTKYKFPFCPWCGADMRGKEE